MRTENSSLSHGSSTTVNDESEPPQLDSTSSTSSSDTEPLSTDQIPKEAPIAPTSDPNDSSSDTSASSNGGPVVVDTDDIEPVLDLRSSNLGHTPSDLDATAPVGQLKCRGPSVSEEPSLGDVMESDETHTGNTPLCHKALDIAPTPSKTWSQRSPQEKRMYVWQCAWKTMAVIGLLYMFLVGLSLLSKSFKVLAGPKAGKMFSFIKLPMTGLMVGMILTVVLQSSSTTTSLTVGLVASRQLTVQNAIPVVMGANIGTSVTNTIVSLAHLRVPEEFERAFSGATVHDFFNILAVSVLLPLELIAHPIELFSEYLVKPMTGSASIPSPVKTIVDPAASLLLKVDTCLSITLGIHPPGRNGGLDFFRACVQSCERCPAGSPLAASAIVGQNITALITSIDQVAGCPQCSPTDYTLVAGGAFVESSISDTAVGVICVLISVVFVITALCLLVKVLAILLKGRASKWFRKSLDLSPYLAMLVGCGITVLVQSSSITTSTLVPLVGHGAITLEQMFPTTLGANVGTTFTGLLAASAVGEPEGVQIALCHMMFNVLGILLFYPIPYVRAAPLECARSLGYQVRRRRWVAPVYMLSVFVVIPMSLLGLSLAGSGGLIAGAVLLYGTAVLAFTWRQIRLRRPDLIPYWVPNVLRPNDRESGPTREFPKLSRMASPASSPTHHSSNGKSSGAAHDKSRNGNSKRDDDDDSGSAEIPLDGGDFVEVPLDDGDDLESAASNEPDSIELISMNTQSEHLS